MEYWSVIHLMSVASCIQRLINYLHVRHMIGVCCVLVMDYSFRCVVYVRYGRSDNFKWYQYVWAGSITSSGRLSAMWLILHVNCLLARLCVCDLAIAMLIEPYVSYTLSHLLTASADKASCEVPHCWVSLVSNSSYRVCASMRHNREWLSNYVTPSYWLVRHERLSLTHARHPWNMIPGFPSQWILVGVLRWLHTLCGTGRNRQ